MFELYYQLFRKLTMLKEACERNELIAHNSNDNINELYHHAYKQAIIRAIEELEEVYNKLSEAE